MNTKLHAIVDGLGNPVEFMLSAGNDHDSVHAVELLKLVECFFQKLKWFRRIATRYDKLDASFLAFVYIAAIAILLI